jgi:iron complex transport system ATP-binding protein
MENNSNEILSLDSLRIGYISGNSRNVLLAPLYATASKGELIAVIGRNGIGKSTLLRTLTGIQPSIEGSIFISGRDIKDFSRLELAQKVGFISTEIVKITNMTVYELVSLGRFPYTNWIGKIERIDHEIIMDSIMKTGMENLYDRNISELSDGERQRAMIARVLAQDTEIVIMDEPTAFLDIKSKYEIVHLMHDLALKRGKTIIFSTHDLSIAISQADKIWLTLNEKLVQGAPEDLMIQGAFDHLFDSSVVGFNSKPDCPADDVADAVFELSEDQGFFGLANLLHQRLFGVLGRNATKSCGRYFNLNFFANLGVGLDAAGVKNGDLIVLGDDFIRHDEAGECLNVT